MTVYGLTLLLLFYFTLSFALGDGTASGRKNSPTVSCDGGICVLKTTDTDFELSVELLERHVGPDVVIVNTDEYPGDGFSIGLGVIIVTDAAGVDTLASAILRKAAVLEEGVIKIPPYFVQLIRNLEYGNMAGILRVERPTSDPDARFESLAQDSLLAGIPEGLRSVLDPEALIPTPTDGCDTNKCVAIIPSADVFYFAADPTNTACLSAITGAPPLPTVPPIDMDPSYAYVVYPGAQLFDGCRNWLGGLDITTTARFRPEQLSTLEYRPDQAPTTKVLDFADLPCPPSDVAQIYDPTIPYYPILEIPVAFGLPFMPVNESNQYDERPQCKVAAVRDPPVRARRVGRITGRKGGGGTIA
ncbi:MAG: hypothetical protein Q9169_007163 [Polycauliona sp. 2 TL-2023]